MKKQTNFSLNPNETNKSKIPILFGARLLTTTINNKEKDKEKENTTNTSLMSIRPGVQQNKQPSRQVQLKSNETLKFKSKLYK